MEPCKGSLYITPLCLMTKGHEAKIRKIERYSLSEVSNIGSRFGLIFCDNASGCFFTCMCLLTVVVL